MPTIAANLVIEEGKLLMLHRRDKGYWELPAGKVEKGEAAREAAIREAEEEIGVEVDIQEEWNEFQVEFRHEGRNFSTRGFISQIKEGDPEIQEEVFDQLEWIPARKIAEIELAPNLEMVRDELQKLVKDR